MAYRHEADDIHQTLVLASNYDMSPSFYHKTFHYQDKDASARSRPGTTRNLTMHYVSRSLVGPLNALAG